MSCFPFFESTPVVLVKDILLANLLTYKETDTLKAEFFFNSIISRVD